MVPRDVPRRRGELGFLGIRYPTEYGGSDMDTLATVVLAEELGRSILFSVAITVLVHTDMASVHLFNAGSQAIKDRCKPDVAVGRKIVAVGVTEPGAGSDVKGIRTTARRDRDSYVLNGAKMFIANGVHADLYCVAATTNPEMRPSQRASMLSRQTLRHRLAMLAAKVEAGRQLVYHAAWLVTRGNARVQSIGGGTTEVMLEEVAKRMR